MSSAINSCLKFSSRYICTFGLILKFIFDIDFYLTIVFSDRKGRSTFATKVLATVFIQFGVLSAMCNTFLYSSDAILDWFKVTLSWNLTADKFFSMIIYLWLLGLKLVGSPVIWPLCTGDLDRFPNETKCNDTKAEEYFFARFLDSTYWVSFNNNL